MPPPQQTRGPSNSERWQAILRRARASGRASDPLAEWNAPAAAWEGVQNLHPSQIVDEPLALDRARQRAQEMSEREQPFEGLGFFDPVVAGVRNVADAAVDVVVPYRPGEDQRNKERLRYAGQAAAGAGRFVSGLGDWWNEHALDDQSVAGAFDTSARDARRDWAQTTSDRMAADSGRYLAAPDVMTIEGERPSRLERLGTFADDMFWTGLADARDDATQNRVIASEMADFWREAGDEQKAEEFERAAEDSAASHALMTGFGVAELAPGWGVLPSLAQAGRGTARIGLRAAGREVPDFLQAPVREAAEESLVPLLTSEGRQFRNEALASGAFGYGTGALADRALSDEGIDGQTFDAVAAPAIGTAFGVAGSRLLPLTREFGDNLIGIGERGAVARRVGYGAAEQFGEGTRVYEDGYARTTIEPDGRIVHTYQGGFGAGATEGAGHPLAVGTGGEAVSSMRAALNALERDIAETGRPSYSWRAGPDDATDPRLAQFYREYFRTRTPQGYVFSESADGTMHLNRAVDAEATPVRIGEQVNRDGSVAPRDPIDWEAPVAPERSSLRDLGIASATGGVFGAGVSAILDSEAQASDGSEADWTLGEVPALPILSGAIGAGTLAALWRGRLGQANRSQVGMFAGVNARTADRAALERAQEMATSGASRDAIWQETGWFQGVDGKWRFEIDDSRARINLNASDDFENFGVMDADELGDALQHDRLYDAYPQMRGTLLSVERGDEAAGGYGHRVITVQAPNLDDARSVMLHEGQHDIQQQIEGFARGGSPQIRYPLAVDDPEVARLLAEYEAIKGEMTVARGREYYELRDLLEQIGERISEASDFATYRRSAGEVEARNVQTRRDFTPEERRARAPWETQDVPYDQQIVRFDGDRAEMSGGRRLWTDAERTRAQELLNQGMTLRQVAAELGRAPGSVQINTTPVRPRGGGHQPINPAELNPGNGPRTRGEPTEYMEQAYQRVAEAAETLARANGGRLPHNAYEELAVRTGYAPGSIKAMMSYARAGVAGDALAARFGAINSVPVGAPPVNAEFLARHLDDGLSREALLERLNAYRAERGMAPTNAASVSTTMSQLRAARRARGEEPAVREVTRPAGSGVDPAWRGSSQRARLRRRNDPLDAIAPIGVATAGGGLLLASEAKAEEGEVLSDGRMIDTNMPQDDLREGEWLDQTWSHTSLADGSPALMRTIELPDGRSYTIVGVQGRSGEIDFLGTVQPTEGAPGPHYPVGDVYEHAYDNSQPSAPYEPPPQRLGDNSARIRPALASGAGLAASLLVPGRYGNATRMATSGVATGVVDSALGGDWTEFLPLAAGVAGGGEFLRAGVDDVVRRLGVHGEDLALRFDPEFRAQRDAFALTLSDELPSVRVMETQNYHGEIRRPDEGLFGAEPIIIPDRELAEQGYAFDRPVENMPTQREQFLDADPATQREWMRRAGALIEPDTGEFGSVSGRELPQLPPLERGMPPMDRRTRGERTGAAVLRRAGSRPAGSTMGGFIEAAQREGVAIPRGRNNRETAENIARAVRGNPRLEQLARDWGLSALLAAGIGAGSGYVLESEAEAADEIPMLPPPRRRLN